jgi:hypothetical protein
MVRDAHVVFFAAALTRLTEVLAAAAAVAPEALRCFAPVDVFREPPRFAAADVFRAPPFAGQGGQGEDERDAETDSPTCSCNSLIVIPLAPLTPSAFAAATQSAFERFPAFPLALRREVAAGERDLRFFAAPAPAEERRAEVLRFDPARPFGASTVSAFSAFSVLLLHRQPFSSTAASVADIVTFGQATLLLSEIFCDHLFWQGERPWRRMRFFSQDMIAFHFTL